MASADGQNSGPRSFLSRRAGRLRSSTVLHLSRLAQQRNAINLAEGGCGVQRSSFLLDPQNDFFHILKSRITDFEGLCHMNKGGTGFPDFPAPKQFKDAAISAITSDFNQYRHVQGVCDKVAEAFELAQGLKVNPHTQVTICCGQSEALIAAILAVVDEEDEVLLLDPSYETYEASVVLAGGKAKHVSMSPPYWTLDLESLERAMSAKTKALIINSPHNPTGKVFCDEELAGIAKLCCQFDCLAITDEVYEHILLTENKHKSLASFAGMQERTIVTSSISKTFSVTGWRVGWAIASETITSAISKIHETLTDSAPAPFQEAAVSAFSSTPDYYVDLKKEYIKRRDFVCDMLEEAGFILQCRPEGSFFVFAEMPPNCHLTDVEYAAVLIEKVGVAVVPGCGFFHSPDSCLEKYTRRFIRVAFCKNMSTLFAARKAMQSYRKCQSSKL